MGSVVSRAAENNSLLPDIPDELITTEILSRLPVKSVVRSRCVCKSWNSLLSGDPDFVKLHLTRYSMNVNNGSLICRCDPHFKYSEFHHPLKSMFIKLGGSVNGLVCVYYHYVGCSISCVGIWNPAINLYKDIPIPPSAGSKTIPGLYDFSFGIGFDPIANDYKVVYITIYPDQPFVADVYSCNAGSWGQNSVKSTFLSRGVHFPSCTIVHGRPYWYNDFTDNYYVMFFDVQEEVFGFLPGIAIGNKSKRQKVMVNLRDSLAFMFYDYSGQTTSRFYDYSGQSTSRFVHVYIFDEICGLWTKNYTIGPITLPAESMQLRNCFPNGDLLFSYQNKLALVSVNSETHAINKLDSDIYSFNASRWSLYGAYSFGYVESLVSVKGMNIVYVEEVGPDILIVEKDL